MYRNFIWHSPNMHMLDFKVYQMDGPWLGVAGIYMFCHVNSTGYLDIHYIGKASNFYSRFCKHEKWAPAQRPGADIVLAAICPLGNIRDYCEKQLISQFRPALNNHFTGSGGGEMLVS